MERYAVVYTNYSQAGPGVSLALTQDFRTFERYGEILSPENKDAALLPRRIGDKWALIHRPVSPQGAHIWISYSPDLRHWVHMLGQFLRHRRPQGRELTLREQVLALSRQVLGPEHPDTLMWIGGLASSSYYDIGRKEEALQLRDQVLALDRKMFGPEHAYTLYDMRAWRFLTPMPAAMTRRAIYMSRCWRSNARCSARSTRRRSM